MDRSIHHLGDLAVANALSGKAPSLNGKAADTPAERRKLAQEFTSFLYLEVLKAMRATLPEGGFIESESLSRDIYTSMFDTEIARLMAKRDHSGFVATVEKSLEKTSPPKASHGSAEPPAAQGVVSSAFGPRTDPLTGVRRFHSGVDIAARAGAEVKAAAPGRVIFSGWLDGYGNVVDIDHGNGWVSRYGHNQENLAREGDRVEAGQAIARVGSSGRTTGAHVHFELRRFGTPVDPQSLLGPLAKGQKVRSIA